MGSILYCNPPKKFLVRAAPQCSRLLYCSNPSQAQQDVLLRIMIRWARRGRLNRQTRIIYETLGFIQQVPALHMGTFEL